MAKYYALVAGLPNLSVDAAKAPISLEEYREELEALLSSSDKALLDLVTREEEHKALLQQLRAGAFSLEALADLELAEDTLETEEQQRTYHLQRFAQAAYLGAKKPKNTAALSYQEDFIYDLCFRDEEEAETQQQAQIELLSSHLLEDRLAQYYYAWAEKSTNKFLAAWFRLNKNIRNILVVYTCRHLAWDPKEYVVGDSYIEQQLITSKAKDFDLSDDLEYLPQLLQIAEEKDIARRERLIDLLKWQWLDAWVELRLFDIDNVLAYYLRLQIVERWSRLDQQTGAETFRQIVHGLKKESNKSLEAFKLQRTKVVD